MTTTKTLDWKSLIDQAYLARKRENLCPIRGSALGDCPRKLAGLLLGLEKSELSAKTLRIFELGTSRGRDLGTLLAHAHPSSVHREQEVWIPLPGVPANRVVDVLRKAETAWGTNDIPLSISLGKDQLMVRARCDVLAFLPKDVVALHHLEIKTKNSYGFELLDKEGPDEGYAVQVMAQRAGLEQAGYEVLSSSILYENKDTCEHKVVEIVPEHWNDRYQEAIADVSNLLVAWVDQKPIEEMARARYADGVKVGRLPWQCNYCAIGPIRGRCMLAARLKNKAKEGQIPKWEALPEEDVLPA
jgi:hypothetical protein